MKLHEHQAKTLFRSYDIPVPEGRLVETGQDALAAAKELQGPAS